MFGGYTFQADGSILMFLEEGRVGVLRDGSLDIVIDGLPGEGENRFNDVIADPEGRVYCGTMCKDSAKAMAEEAFGSLYVLDTDGNESFRRHRHLQRTWFHARPVRHVLHRQPYGRDLAIRL